MLGNGKGILSAASELPSTLVLGRTDAAKREPTTEVKESSPLHQELPSTMVLGRTDAAKRDLLIRKVE